MLLYEVLNTDAKYVPVFRAFSIPLRQVWGSTSQDFHNPAFINSLKGTWIALTQAYTLEQGYGEEPSGTTLQIPLYATYLMSKRLALRPPINHVPHDDAEIPGETMKVQPTDLKQLVEVKMRLDNKWVPFNKLTLFKALTNNSESLASLMSSQEIEKLDCPTPGCITHEEAISDIDQISGLCPICLKDFGLDKIIPRLKYDI